MRYATKREAARAWVQEMDAIYTGMFSDYADAYPDDVYEVTVMDDEDQEDRYYDSRFPMWGAMWQFHDILDNEWIDMGGLEAMSKIGFRIYKSENYGYFFGIDAAGYDFYERFWIPLYDARGLHWHDEEEGE